MKDEAPPRGRPDPLPCAPLLRAWRLEERNRRGWGSGAEGLPSDAARRRLERWRAQAPLDREDAWRRRLASAGLAGPGEGAVLRLLEAPSGEASAEPGPGFARRLAAIYADPRGDGPRPGGVFTWIEPLLGAARRGLRRAVPSLAGSDLELDLVRFLADSLHRRMARTLVLELRIAALEERLEGESSEERFASFHRRLADPAAAWELMCAYPVLARSLEHAASTWRVFAGELLRHAAEDRAALAGALCGGADPGPLVRVRPSGGDPHRGGRCVLRVRFASGLEAAYKPRSLAAEEIFAEALGDLGPLLDPEDRPRWPGALDRGDHGWMPWVSPRPIERPGGAERFYRRQGALLAVLHALGATDLHFENLIADGEHPVPVDLETLAHPLLPATGTGRVDESGLDDSVLRVGLLPHRLEIGGDLVDPSGLGADADQPVARSGARFEGAGTDNMRVVPSAGTLGETPGRPTYGPGDDRSIDAADFGEQVVLGFRAARAALGARSAAWSAPGGLLERLAEVEVRVVLRPTRVYALLLQEAFHPQMLRDGLEHDMLFDRLWLGAEQQPLLGQTVASEARDLAFGDVPLFVTRAGSRRLQDARGVDLGELLPESALEGARRRLARLAVGEDQQERLVSASFELRAAERGLRPRRRSSLDLEAGGAVDPEQCLELARRAGDLLAHRAFRDRRGARWAAPRRLAAGRWTLLTAGPDLYYGVSGIALFLASLAEISGEESYGELADEAIETVRRDLEVGDAGLRERLGLLSPGAFDGLGGVIYALARLGALRRRPGLLDLALEQLEPLGRALEGAGDGADETDLMSGHAGALIALVRLRRMSGGRSEALLASLIERCLDLLVRGARPHDAGSAWPPAHGGPALGGMAHGAAGIAWALAEGLASRGSRLEGSRREGARRARREAIDDAIDAALDYEDSLIDQGNWRDLRERPVGESDTRLVAWCHGAAGVALGRLGILRADAARADSETAAGRPAARRRRLEDDLNLAVGTTLERGFGLNHSLCHGDLGNLDILLRIARARGDRALERRVSELGAAVAASVRRQGFLFGSPGGTEPPGLMVGAAGLGYGLLCLAAPDRVPSLLWLGLPSEKEPSFAF
ncbi:MAG: type 2 lanthipeptide synthetase LanM family protein [Acidobacteriota bacterium]